MICNKTLRELERNIFRISSKSSIPRYAPNGVGLNNEIAQRGRVKVKGYAVTARPKPGLRRGEKKQTATLPIGSYLPPLDLLKSAKRAGVLTIEPDDALHLIQKYVDLSARKQTGWEEQLCQEEKIAPNVLYIISLILNRCPDNPRKILAKQLMLTASSLGDITATIAILNSALRSGSIQDPTYAPLLSRLNLVATSPSPDPEALLLIGRIHESQGRILAALEAYQHAASIPPSSPPDIEGGQPSVIERVRANQAIAEALVAQGQILRRRNDIPGARSAFKKAAVDYDSPAGYFRLAESSKEDTPEREMGLLKAASSGVSDAAYLLGEIWLTRVKDGPDELDRSSHAGARSGNRDPKGKKGDKPPQHDKAREMAKEWLYLSATTGKGESMLKLAAVFKAEGRAESGLKWLQLAEGEGMSAPVRKEARKLRASWDI